MASNIGWYISYDLKDDALRGARQTITENKNKYDKAQLEAANKSLQDKINKEAEDAANTEKANLAYAALYDKYRASLVRLSESQRPTAKFDMSQASSVTHGGDTTSESSGLSVTITLPDAEICAENTARLVTIHEWAKTYK